MVLIAQDAQAQNTGDVPTVAVMDFNGLMVADGGNSIPIGKAVSSMLVTEFSGREGLKVLERANLQSILTEQKLALSGRVEESSAVEIGKMLGVQYMFYGAVVSMGNQLRVDIRAVNVETTEVVTVLKKNDTPEQLLDVVVWVADEFTKKLNLVPPSGRPPVEAVPVKATIEFSRGVDFEDRGDTAKALEHYQKALEVYPNHRDAQRAVARLRAGDV
jgi:TolB-like protein